MRMGLFATLGAYGPANLYHLLLDNSAHDSTGGQATVSTGVSFARIASACGYPWAEESDDVTLVDRLLDSVTTLQDDTTVTSAEGIRSGPRFARLLTRTGSPDNLPRPSVTPVQVRERLQAHIGI
jgi:phosphonopyruvate decarboxylase